MCSWHTGVNCRRIRRYLYEKQKESSICGLDADGTDALRLEINVDNKDKVAIFNDIEIPAGVKVIGDAVALFGDVVVNGDLSGDAVAIFGKIYVKDNGVISGNATGILGGVEKSSGGMIRGEIVDINTPFNAKKPGGLIPRISYGDMIGLVTIYAFSCLAILIVPDRIRLCLKKASQCPAGDLP